MIDNVLQSRIADLVIVLKVAVRFVSAAPLSAIEEGLCDRGAKMVDMRPRASRLLQTSKSLRSQHCSHCSRSTECTDYIWQQMQEFAIRIPRRRACRDTITTHYVQPSEEIASFDWSIVSARWKSSLDVDSRISGHSTPRHEGYRYSSSSMSS